MSKSRDDAVSQIEYFFRTYLAPYYQDEEHTRRIALLNIELLDERIVRGQTPLEALSGMAHTLIAQLGVEAKIPTITGAIGSVSFSSYPFAELVAPSNLVDLLHPTASAATKAALVDAIQQGHISNTDFVGSMLDVGRTDKAPSADRLIEAIYAAGKGTPPLPDLDLAFPGLTDTQTEFLIGLYVAAFNRAPEHGGLKHWAGDLAKLLGAGVSEADAVKQLAKSLYFSGTQSGEQGTALSAAAYVAFVYKTVLGRDGDAGGIQHWSDELSAGADRSHFVAVFLTSALQAAGDGDYLKARIAVAEHAAQAHVSGPNTTIDLAALLAGISDASDAYLAIRALPAAPAAAAAASATLPLLMRAADGFESALPDAVDTADAPYGLLPTFSGSADPAVHLIGQQPILDLDTVAIPG